MAIIVRSSDIYEKNSHNILLNNAIASVSLQEKVLEFDENGAYITMDEPAEVSSTATFGGAANFVLIDGSASMGNSPRIEAYYTTGRVQIPRESTTLMPSGIEWKISGKYGDGLTNPSISLTLEQVKNKDVGYFYDTSQFVGDKEKDFNQTGLWGQEGEIKLTKGPSFAKIKDESYAKIIEEGESFYIDYKILTTVVEVVLYNGIYADEDNATGFEIKGKVSEANVYIGSTITFMLYHSGVEISDAKNQITVGDTSKGAPFAIETNQLLQPETTINGERIGVYNANKILRDWKNGKESAVIDVMVGDYYDMDGSLVISVKEGSLPMTFKIGDLIIPYVSTSREVIEGETSYLVLEEVPLSEYDNGAAKIFTIYDIEQLNDGIGFQRLKIIESYVRAVDVNITDQTGTLKITRTLSPLANAKLGELTVDDPIYIEDEITITATGDLREWSLIVDGLLQQTEVDTTGFTASFVASGDIDISIIKKVWRWVNYGELKEYTFYNLQTKSYNSTGLTWSDEYNFPQYGVKAGLQHEFIFYVKFYSPLYNETFTSNLMGRLSDTYSWGIPETTDDDKSVVMTYHNGTSRDRIKDCVSTDPYYVFKLPENNGFMVNCLKINVVEDNRVKFTSEGRFYNTNSGGSGENNYNNYITGISEFVVRQYEYS